LKFAFFFATPRLKIQKILVFGEKFEKSVILGFFVIKICKNDPNKPYKPYILSNMNCHKQIKRIAFYLSEKYLFFEIWRPFSYFRCFVLEHRGKLPPGA